MNDLNALCERSLERLSTLIDGNVKVLGDGFIKNAEVFAKDVDRLNERFPRMFVDADVAEIDAEVQKQHDMCSTQLHKLFEMGKRYEKTSHKDHIMDLIADVLSYAYQQYNKLYARITVVENEFRQHDFKKVFEDRNLRTARLFHSISYAISIIFHNVDTFNGILNEIRDLDNNDIDLSHEINRAVKQLKSLRPLSDENEEEGGSEKSFDPEENKSEKSFDPEENQSEKSYDPENISWSGSEESFDPDTMLLEESDDSFDPGTMLLEESDDSFDPDPNDSEQSSDSEDLVLEDSDPNPHDGEVGGEGEVVGEFGDNGEGNDDDEGGEDSMPSGPATERHGGDSINDDEPRPRLADDPYERELGFLSGDEESDLDDGENNIMDDLTHRRIRHGYEDVNDIRRNDDFYDFSDSDHEDNEDDFYDFSDSDHEDNEEYKDDDNEAGASADEERFLGWIVPTHEEYAANPMFGKVFKVFDGAERMMTVGANSGRSMPYVFKYITRQIQTIIYVANPSFISRFVNYMNTRVTQHYIEDSSSCDHSPEALESTQMVVKKSPKYENLRYTDIQKLEEKWLLSIAKLFLSAFNNSNMKYNFQTLIDAEGGHCLAYFTALRYKFNQVAQRVDDGVIIELEKIQQVCIASQLTRSNILTHIQRFIIDATKLNCTVRFTPSLFKGDLIVINILGYLYNHLEGISEYSPVLRRTLAEITNPQYFEYRHIPDESWFLNADYMQPHLFDQLHLAKYANTEEYFKIENMKSVVQFEIQVNEVRRSRLALEDEVLEIEYPAVGTCMSCKKGIRQERRDNVLDTMKSLALLLGISNK